MAHCITVNSNLWIYYKEQLKETCRKSWKRKYFSLLICLFCFRERTKQIACSLLLSCFLLCIKNIKAKVNIKTICSISNISSWTILLPFYFKCHYIFIQTNKYLILFLFLNMNIINYRFTMFQPIKNKLNNMNNTYFVKIHFITIFNMKWMEHNF